MWPVCLISQKRFEEPVRSRIRPLAGTQNKTNLSDLSDSGFFNAGVSRR